jgi:dihydrofolate reductase
LGRIVISKNLSCDGVVEDPTGEEGFARGGWFTRVTDNDQRAWAKTAFDEACSAEALLLGRRTYEFFAARWPGRTGPFADQLNRLPKYVVSSTLHSPDWANTTVLHGDVITKVSALKRRLQGDVVVYASFGLVPLLVEHDLVDELRLTIYPFLLGDGRHLFSTARGDEIATAPPHHDGRRKPRSPHIPVRQTESPMSDQSFTTAFTFEQYRHMYLT